MLSYEVTWKVKNDSDLANATPPTATVHAARDAHAPPHTSE